MVFVIQTKCNFTLIDNEDEDLIFSGVWITRSDKKYNYVYIRRNKKHYYIHRIIMERIIGRKLKMTEIIDHINHDTLDNRRENLRIVNKSKNGVNRDKRHMVEKRGDKYIVRFRHKYLGTFNTEKEALDVYEKHKTIYMEEF